jgi:hypothetical protein
MYSSRKEVLIAGLFALAFATALCLEQDLANFQFDQTAMQTHLKSCLIKGSPQMFSNDLRRIAGRLTAPIVPFYGRKDYNPEFPYIKTNFFDIYFSVFLNAYVTT